MTLRVSMVLLGFLALLLPAAPAQAQPDGILRHCVAEIHRTTEATVGAIAEQTEAGVHVIARLDHSDASNERLIAAARHAVAGIHQSAGRGINRINHVTERCIHALRRMGAGDDAIMVVLRARSIGIHAIQRTTRRGHNIIAHALHRALNN